MGLNDSWVRLNDVVLSIFRPDIQTGRGCRPYLEMDGQGEIAPMASAEIGRKEGRKEMFYLTTHSTHFIYGYMASDIWLRTILIVKKETRCRHIGYSLRLAARVLLYAPSHRQDNTYHGLCYTSRGVEIAPVSKHMTPKIFITITCAKKIMIMQLIVEKYYYS